MSWWTLVVIAVGLSADAFAVAVGKGLQLGRVGLRTTLAVALTFGGFQALMPLLGWWAGSQFAEALAPYDHWIAFGLLSLIGLKMIKEALGADPEPAGESASGTGSVISVGRIGTRELLVLGLATSIDALAAGVGFAMVSVPIGWAVLLIGVITAVLSAVGLQLGRTVGPRFRAPAEILGGVILIAIGVNILIDHLT